MEIVEKIEIMTANPVWLWIGVALFFAGAVTLFVGLFLLWRGRDLMVALVGALVATLGILSIMLSTIDGISIPTGRYRYKAHLSDRSVIEELYDRYENVEFENDYMVTFEDWSI